MTNSSFVWDRIGEIGHGGAASIVLRCTKCSDQAIVASAPKTGVNYRPSLQPSLSITASGSVAHPALPAGSPDAVAHPALPPGSPDGAVGGPGAAEKTAFTHNVAVRGSVFAFFCTNPNASYTRYHYQELLCGNRHPIARETFEALREQLNQLTTAEVKRQITYGILATK